MKIIVLLKFVFLPLMAVTPLTCTTESQSTTFGVFGGTSLCAEVSRPLLNIPPAAQCDRTKWNLTLYVDSRTQSPTTYKLSSEYGFHIDNRTFLTKGSNVREGTWSIATGAKTDPNATVYELEPADPKSTVLFLRIDENLIHLLDRDRSLMIGSAAQSFTLSRIDKISSVTTPLVNSRTTHISSRKSLDSTPIRVFEGRTPCREVAQQLSHPVGADCFKLKWGVTLYQDPITLTPTRFKLRGTLFRDFDREGTWAIHQGRRGDPSATVYKLDFPDIKGSLLFYKADDNVLFFLHNDGTLMVGNQDFSYTLNRATRASNNVR